MRAKINFYLPNTFKDCVSLDEEAVFVNDEWCEITEIDDDEFEQWQHDNLRMLSVQAFVDIPLTEVTFHIDAGINFHFGTNNPIFDGLTISDVELHFDFSAMQKHWEFQEWENDEYIAALAKTIELMRRR